MTIQHLFPTSKPTLDLNFAAERQLDPRITFTRSTVGTYVDDYGIVQTAAVDEPRFDYDGGTGESLGLLIEEARTNLFLNSATLVTQSITSTSGEHSLSFYGTGTVVLSGSATGTLVGTGANDRVSLVVTATAGTITATVTGSVTNAQVESGDSPTSYIPTTGSTATRAADICTIEGDNFSSWYNQSEGTIFAEFPIQTYATDTDTRILSFADSASTSMSTGNGIIFGSHTGSFTQQRWGVRGSSVTEFSIATSVVNKTILAYATGDLAQVNEGGTSQTSTNSPPTGLDRLNIFPPNVPISRLSFYPRRLSDEQLQALTA